MTIEPHQPPQSAVQGVTQVADHAVDVLKTNPSCLAAIALAAIFAILTFVALQRDAERRSKTVDVLIDRCMPPGEGYNNPRRTEP